MASVWAVGCFLALSKTLLVADKGELDGTKVAKLPPGAVSDGERLLALAFIFQIDAVADPIRGFTRPTPWLMSLIVGVACRDRGIARACGTGVLRMAGTRGIPDGRWAWRAAFDAFAVTFEAVVASLAVAALGPEPELPALVIAVSGFHLVSKSLAECSRIDLYTSCLNPTHWRPIQTTLSAPEEYNCEVSYVFCGELFLRAAIVSLIITDVVYRNMVNRV